MPSLRQGTFLSQKTLVEKELTTDRLDFYRMFMKNEEDYHGGETFKFQDEEIQNEEYKNLDSTQYETVIINDENEKYFIYDEIIKKYNKPYYNLKIHNDKKEEIIESIIYLKNDIIIKQIRYFTYEQFLNLVKKEQYIVEEENESENVTIIKTPFLEFLENVNNDEEKAEKKRKLINKYEKKYKKMRVLFWIGIIIFFFLSWGFFPIVANYIIPNLGLGLAATDVTTSIIAGLITGATITGLSFGGYKFKKWLFPKMKEELELKLKNKIKKHDKRIIDKLQRELSLSWTPENKETRIFSAFKEIINKNKNKDFETLSQELNDKFKENKLELEKINYEQNIKKINENKLNLKDNPEHIEKDYRVCSPIKKITLH